MTIMTTCMHLSRNSTLVLPFHHFLITNFLFGSLSNPKKSPVRSSVFTVWHGLTLRISPLNIIVYVCSSIFEIEYVVITCTIYFPKPSFSF
ncbi:hypothetical protein Hanom_Chr02g00095451 [Helianthus anomalus]